MRIAIAALAGYLLGAIPFAYLVVRGVTGQDLRTSGNGNVGARNAIAVAGLKAGLGVLLLDGLKGAAAYGVALLLGGEFWVVTAAALGAVLGHWFPFWLRFRGGVGQAAISGFLVAMWPLPGLVGVALFGLGRLLFRLFNMAYALAALGYLAAAYWLYHDWHGLGLALALLAAMIAKKLADMPRQRRIIARQKESHSEPDHPPRHAHDLAALDALFLEGDRWHTAHEPTHLSRAQWARRETSAFLQSLLDAPDSTSSSPSATRTLAGRDHARHCRPPARPAMLLRGAIGVIDTLIVAERVRRQGIGRRLMLAAEAGFREQGCTDLQITVWDFNTGALDLYDCLGYRPLLHRLGKTVGLATRLTARPVRPTISA